MIQTCTALCTLLVYMHNGFVHTALDTAKLLALF